MISVRNLTKVYKLKGKGGENNVVALNGVSVDFPDKGLVFLLGKSGSGKSTLLNTVGGLDTFDSGEIIIKGKSSKNFKQSDFDSYRNTFIGFIFQEYNILEEFTVGKNLSLALELQGKNPKKSEVNKLLDQVDLTGYYKRKPNQLSGGQKQRVAIARALIKDPEIIMADEPTGALDSNTGRQVMDTLKKLSQDKLVIIVSHDREFAEIYGDRVIELKDGKIIRDETKHEVEPVKSESGISFIDDKIIHIKKGQHFDKEDLVHIGKLIVENASRSDTIISFDEKSNTDIKKTAFITDEGNREVFKDTKPEDVVRQQYDGKNFHMIKSRLRLKDSFKMGASSLKHKPVRLFFTILLAFVAFGVFGLVDAMSQFNRADSLNATIAQQNIEVVGIQKRVKENEPYGIMPIQERDIETLKESNGDYDFYPVIYGYNNYGGGTYRLYVSNYDYSSNSEDYDNPFSQPYISGVMSINQDIEANLNLTMLAGRLPTAADEIIIAENLYDIVKKYYKDVEDAQTFVSKGVQCHVSGQTSSNHFTIVGIVKNNIDTSKYDNVTNWSSNYKMREEVYFLLQSSLINMCYVTQDAFDTEYSNYANISSNKMLSGENPNGNHFSTEIKTLSYAKELENHLVVARDGVDINNLKADQCILSEDVFKNYFEVKDEDVIAKFNEGVRFEVEDYNDMKYSYDIVAIAKAESYYFTHSDENGNHSQWIGLSRSLIISDESYAEKYIGYSSLITKLKDNDNSKLLNFCSSKYYDGYYSVQCIATPMLDDYGGMVTGASKYLLYVAIGIAVFASLMLMNFISVSITYKKREIGVLRAIGARGKDVFSIFFAESFIVCIINFVLATIACAIACTLINGAFVSAGFTITLLIFTPRQIALIFGISLFVAFISSFFPVYRFAKKNPIDCINNR